MPVDDNTIRMLVDAVSRTLDRVQGLEADMVRVQARLDAAVDQIEQLRDALLKLINGPLLTMSNLLAEHAARLAALEAPRCTHCLRPSRPPGGCGCIYDRN